MTIRIGRGLGIGLMVAVSIVAALSLAEFALRLRPATRPPKRWYVGQKPNRPSANFLPDSLTGWRLRPHHTFRWNLGGEWSSVVSNAQGMRGPADFTAACGRPRIILIGDSFIFGTGVAYEQSVGAQLEDSLARAADVYNLAMPGFGIDQMWMALRHQALALCPSLLVVGFIDGDWDRSLTPWREVEGMNKPMFLLERGALRRATAADRPGPVTGWLRGLALRHLLNLTLRNRAYQVPTGYWWELNTAMFDAMAGDAAAAHLPILFVRVPRKHGWRAFPTLRQHLRRAHVPYLDLADPALTRDDVHLANDDHINARGDAWLAGAISAWIRASGPAALRPSLRPGAATSTVPAAR